MLLQRFYDPRLAQASYLVGCPATGEALVVDPARDVRPYLEAARAEGVRVTHVTETHIHADFVSGARELARAAGARLLLSGEGGDDWQYAYAAGDGATLLHDGDTFDVGRVQVTVWHTPGHTPEHLTFVVTDGAAAAGEAIPFGAFTGDFVFAGDVGRPDLLEKAAGQAGTMTASARALYRSLQRLTSLPDHLQLWPGHGAGSACGKALGAVPQTTLGYERRVNWAFAAPDEAAFVRAVLDGQPDPPAYFATMKRVNRAGPAPAPAPLAEAPLAARDIVPTVDAGAFVVDTRPAAAYGTGHLPDSLSVPLGRSFATWAGWLLPYDSPLYLVAADAASARDAARALASVGLDDVAGWYAADDALAAWTAAGRALAATPETDVTGLADALAAGRVAAIDVRAPSEWAAGHLPGVPNVPLGQLRARAGEVAVLAAGRPLVVQCQGGARSAMGAGVLAAAGVGNVVNLAGGFAAWERAGLPVER